MLIIGAMGHAKEILDVLHKRNELAGLMFYDSITQNLPEKLYDTFPIIRNDEAAKRLFETVPEFVLGIGGCQNRYKLSNKMEEYGGVLCSVISIRATIGAYNVNLGKGLNIMNGVLISNDVTIGNGTLVNANCLIHHDVRIGEFCEISPGVILTGKVKVGDFTLIGSGAVILPNVNIGSNVIIGAGAVVTKDVHDNSIALGLPARSKALGILSKIK